LTTIAISPPASDEDLAATQALFREYVSAPGWEAGFVAYLAQQAFDTELADLRRVYAPPTGQLLLARVNGEPAGCVAFKPLEPPVICEMKRLFVRSRFRTLGLGRRLIEAVLAEAAAAGYTRMRLDTLPSMRAAQRLYHAVGFREIPPYCTNPVVGAVFMECELTGSLPAV
jgi:ribosomal protein S18 acetylase RimI-like enzyme